MLLRRACSIGEDLGLAAFGAAIGFQIKLRRACRVLFALGRFRASGRARGE